MAASPVYRSALLYQTVMIGLYGRHYFARYRAIADLIPDHSSVLDVCCGPAIVYDRYLRAKQVRYTGLDISARFIDRLRKRGGDGRVWNVRNEDCLPEADYVIMHASLCHFLPDARPVVDRMLRAARRQVIIAEPVRNVTTTRVPLLGALARHLTDPGDGHSGYRFTDQTLDEFFAAYAGRLARTFYVPGGREKVFILNAAGSDTAGNAGVPLRSADDLLDRAGRA